ncbi:MAG: NAD kinase [Saprospiraceae bacterium]
MIKNVLIYSQVISEMQVSYLDILLEKLELEGFNIFIYDKFHKYILDITGNDLKYPLIYDKDSLKKENIDLLISIGGDGTILNSAVLINDTEIPIVGINLGRLGFLAIVEKNKIGEYVSKIKRGDYSIQKRSMLKLNSKPMIFKDENIALNDFTVHKSSSPAVIVVHTFLNEKFLTSYWVDGLIISTPTGSTGYSLSCGGPIVFPGSGTFIITPVAPHNLTMRPIIVPDNSKIRLEIESRSESVLCSLDSRYETISPDHELTIQKNDYDINLLVFSGLDFSDNINYKLNWGADKRN